MFRVAGAGARGATHPAPGARGNQLSVEVWTPGREESTMSKAVYMSHIIIIIHRSSSKEYYIKDYTLKLKGPQRVF